MKNEATLVSLRETTRAPGKAVTAQEVVHRTTRAPVRADELRKSELFSETRNSAEKRVPSIERTARTARSTTRIAKCHRICRARCNPNDLLSAIAREFDPVCQALGIALSVRLSSDCRPLWLDFLDLRDGLALLMDVAVDACASAKGGTRSVVEVEVEPRSDGVSLVVRSNGEPVSPLVLRQVLAAEQSVQPPGGIIALALFLARMAAVRGGGELRISTDQAWNRFEMRLTSIRDRVGERGGRSSAPELRVLDGGRISARMSEAKKPGEAKIPMADVSRLVLAFAA